MSDKVLARVEPSVARRAFGVGMLYVLGALTLYLAVATAPPPAALAVLIGLGAVALWLAEVMRRVTRHAVELTETELRDTEGRVIARLDEIVSVDRGMFAFKPSNGFLLKLSRPRGRSWRPGLWWRFGRRVGVGGVTPGHQAKAMADLLTLRLSGKL